MAKRKTRASAPASTILSTEKRSLRSNTTIDTLVVPVPSPPSKKRQTTQQKFLCGTCGDEKIGRSFPDYTPSADCEHLINTCKVCLRTWIDICVGSSEFIRAVDGNGNSTFAIRCPDLFNDKPCPAMMRPVNVEAAATEASYATFVRLARRYIEESTPGWRWCMASDCDNGQVHTKAAPEPQSPVDSPKKKGARKRGKQKTVADNAALGGGEYPHEPVQAHNIPGNQADDRSEEVEETPDICTCTLCGAKACVTCDLVRTLVGQRHALFSVSHNARAHPGAQLKERHCWESLPF